MSDKKRKQLERIKRILVLIAKEYNNKEFRYDELIQFFSDDDIPALNGILSDLEKRPYVIKSSQKNSPLELKATSVFELKYEEITPYTILGLEEKKYTNEELLKAVSKKIKTKNLIKDRKFKNYQIDKILDAYNELKK